MIGVTDKVHWTVAVERWHWFRCPECGHVWGEDQADPGRAWCCGCGTSNSYPEPTAPPEQFDGSEGDGLCTDETPCGNCSRPDPPALIDGSRRSEAGAVVPDPGKWPL